MAVSTREWFGTKEAAHFIGTSRFTLNRWHDKKINPPFYKINGRRRYDRAELERWIADHRGS